MRKAKLSILFIMLAGQLAVSQQMAGFRAGDPFRGEIESVRSETASFPNNDGIEGPRVSVMLINYSADGLKRKTIAYNPDGSIHHKIVENYSPGGKPSRSKYYDGAGNLTRERVPEYDQSGHQTSIADYLANGSLLEKSLFQSAKADGIGLQIKRYGGDEKPLSTVVGWQEGATQRSTSTRRDGSRVETTVERDKSGNYRSEEVLYYADGSRASRTVATGDAGRTWHERTDYDANDNVIRKSLEKYQHDSHGNLTRHASYRWNANLEKFEAFSVTSNTITYRN